MIRTLASTLARLGGSVITVTRQVSDGYDANGRRLAGGVVSFDASANVQPAAGRDRMKLPEGYRDRDVRVVFAVDELRLGDTVTIGVSAFEVGHVEEWEQAGYFRAVCAKVEG